MPIYEFYCGDCHRVYSFLSRAVDTRKRPSCPRCGRPELARRVSAFAISKGREAPTRGGEASEPGDERLQQAMESLAADAEGMNEDDPRQAGRVMRRLFDAAGMPMGAGMEEALRRMEAGEDPEKIETEMGDVFEEDPCAAEVNKGLGGLRRKLHPPTVDPGLYEM